MFEDSQIEIVPFYGEVIGCHSTGYQAAQIRLIPCNEIIQRFEADKFVFIEVRSVSIRLGKVAGRVPEAIKKFGVIEHQSSLGPGTCWPTLPCRIKAVVDLKRWLLPIHNLHDPALRRSDRIESAVGKGQCPRIALKWYRYRTLILTDRGKAKNMSRIGIDCIDPTGRRIQHDIVRPFKSNVGNRFGLSGDRFTGKIREGDDAMIIRVVCVVQLICRVVDKRMLTQNRQRRYFEWGVGALSENESIVIQVSNNFLTPRTERYVSGALEPHRVIATGGVRRHFQTRRAISIRDRVVNREAILLSRGGEGLHQANCGDERQRGAEILKHGIHSWFSFPRLQAPDIKRQVVSRLEIAGRTKIRARSLLFNFYGGVIDQVDDF